MALNKKGKIALFAIGWVVLVGIGAMSYKWIFAPKAEEAQRLAEQQAHDEKLANTSSESRYDHVVTWATDWFTGYAGYRSEEFATICANKGIKIKTYDDGADYSNRLQALANGECEMAVFTIDALTKASAEYGDLPGTIAWISDISHGADAMVAHAKTFPDIDAMNNPDTKFVVIPNSPSETLALVVMDHFKLDKLSSDPWVYANDPKDLYEKYRRSKPGEKLVFVMWEPYISKVLENPTYKVLIDSSKFKDYIVDVAVVSRDYLIKNKQVVQDICEAYFTAMYNKQDSLVQLVTEDAKASGEPVTKDQAIKLARGIRFKNLQENYAHFGIRGGHSLQHIEGIIEEIIRLQVKADVITSDPTNGSYNLLYYNNILESLFNNNFHPGVTNEDIRDEEQLVALTDEEWAKLQPVGTLQVPRLQFRRGTSRLNPASERTLTDLKERLTKWPQYYLIVRGNASSRGDVEANKRLAEARAKTAVDWLVSNGVDNNRIKGESSKPNGSTTVAFILVEIPY